MKKAVLVLLCVSMLLGCACPVMAKSCTEKVTVSELADCYYQCLKAQNSSLKLSDARAYLVNSLSSGFLAKRLKKTSCETFNRAKKIIEFYNEANEEDFTNLYHPNDDLSVNEEEILNDLPQDNSLCLMLFGNQMNDDGTMSDKFRARCKTALAMANKYPNAWIMITGGHTAGYEYPSEAETGKKWLMEHGIAEERIITDELAWDTFANVLCTFTTSDLRNHREIKNFVVVSSDYHVPKCSIYLMTYIYAFGYDLPEGKGGRGYRYCGNLGAVLG